MSTKSFSRLVFLDFLRFCALLYMVVQHGMLILVRPNSGALYDWVMNLVPICPALFLWVSGFVGAILPNKSLANLVQRNLLLASLASLLMFVEYGWQGWINLMAPGILTIFAVLGLSVHLLKQTRFAVLGATSLLILGLLVQYYFGNVLPLTWGYLPWLPDMLFGYLGFIVGSLWSNWPQAKANFKSMILMGLGLMSCLLIWSQWSFSAWVGPISRTEFSIAINPLMAPWNQFGNQHLSAWNLSTIGFIAYASLVVALAGLLGMFEAWLKLVPNWFWWSSRNALWWYVIHLVYWSLLLLMGLGNTSIFLFGLWLLPLFTLMVFGGVKQRKH